MSVAVSPYLAPPQGLGFQNEQRTDLLDALLASCQKSAMNPPLPGYGRNLQPYFTTEIVPSRKEPPLPLTAKGRGKAKKSQKGRTSPVSSSDEETNHPHSKSHVKLTMKASAIPDAQVVQTIKAVYKHQKTGPIVGSTWAGPAFGIAPAASEIPLPSDFLLD